MSSISNYATPQIIEGKYVDQRKLLMLLKNVYGTNNFRVELRLNRYKIYPETQVDRKLSEEQIQDCRAYHKRY